MNRKVLLIGVGVFALVAVAWMLLLWRPAGTELEDARGDLRTVESERDTLNAQLARLRAIESDVPRLQAGIETLRAAVPDDVDLADFILSVNDAGNSSGVRVASVANQEPVLDPNTSLGAVNVSIGASGGYYQALDFLNRLQRMERVLTVESLTLSAGRDNENLSAPPVMQIVLTAKIYSTGFNAQLAQAEAAAAEAAAAPADVPAEGAVDQPATAGEAN